MKQLILLLSLSAAAIEGVQNDCCPKKRVGSDTYTLAPAGEKPLSQTDCPAQCAYRKRVDSDDPHSAQLFCFKNGNASSTCLGETSLSQGFSPSLGYVVLEDLQVCGDFWDIKAGEVACRELGQGAPKEVFGAARYGPPRLGFHDMVPVCSGNEDKLDSCKMMKLPKQCGHPAGVVCRRTTRMEGRIHLDGKPLCSTGFGDTEARALCKEEGFSNGTVNLNPDQTVVPTGFSLKCQSANLDNCQRTICTSGTAANFSCSNSVSDLELVGSSKPGSGSLLFKGGLVCDDKWDIQDASVACQELGYPGAEEATIHSTFGPVETPMETAQGITIPYTADNVQCLGDEDQLGKCAYLEGADCDLGEAAGVICTTLNTTNNGLGPGPSLGPLLGPRHRQKRSAIAVASALTSAAETGAKIIGSAISYFDQKSKEHQAYLKERPDAPDTGVPGVEISLKNEKGYMDVGGEFQPGGMDVKIQNIEDQPTDKKSGGDSFSYPYGIGPLLINGCFGSNYKKGDPCYANSRMSTSCLNMMEAGNYVGMGYDATGGYTHAGRRKSIVQRHCKNKGTYQGEDVPDTMNVFGIYDTSCQGKTYDSLEARSATQREESKLGENKDLLKYGSSSSTQAKGSYNLLTRTAKGDLKFQSQKEKSTETSQRKSGKAEATDSASKSKSNVFEFTCRIRRYEIFLDEVTPDQLSEAFLQDYMNLPIRFFDFRNKAPQKYTRFLERWGTHYIKSASFGGKFTILRQSTISGTETNEAWSSAMQESVTNMFESKASKVDVSAEAKLKLFGTAEANVDVNTEGSQEKETGGSASDNSSSGANSQRTEKQLSVDDLIVEGGDQKVASILSDKDRSGFKTEFKAWLDSIPDYPKGYDFKFGELSDLVNMNFNSLLGDFVPCWERPDVKNNSYIVEVKDDKGDAKKETRNCDYKDIGDFSEQMEKRRLSLKRAIAVYAKNKGRSSTDLTVPPGQKDCEKVVGNDQISFEELVNGKDYMVNFDLLLNIGGKIDQSAAATISFKASKTKVGERNGEGTEGRWLVNNALNNAASQRGPKVRIDMAAGKLTILGAIFTYTSDETGNDLIWTNEDCELNVIRFKNLKGVISCNDTVDWVDTPLATVKSLGPEDQFLPCNLKWNNLQMLMSDQSCVRFTAASAGPIYFALSAVPSNPQTWYYIRISQSDVTVYKANKNLDYSTEASGAVGLGDMDLFQTYIICSEYDVAPGDEQTSKTRLTFGKIAADQTFFRDAKLTTFLVYEDDEPIQPVFFSFAAGEFEVQVVDIENVEVPNDIECAGDTGKKGKRDLKNTCAIKCKKNNIVMKQTLKLKCYSNNETIDENLKLVEIGDYCEADCPVGQTAYPSIRTTCQANSQWTEQLDCVGICDPSTVLGKGSLIGLDGVKRIEEITESRVNCKINQNEIMKDRIVEGSICQVDGDARTCGMDKNGFVFYQTEPGVRCSSTGSWESVADLTPVTEPICSSQPCSELMEGAITSSATGGLVCNFDDLTLSDVSVSTSGKHNEKVVCSLNSCTQNYIPKQPNKVMCDRGEWKDGENSNLTKLSCIPTDGLCEISQITAEVVSDCSQAARVEGTPSQVLGGESCPFSCQDGFLPKGVLQCVQNTWTSASCIPDTRCKVSTLSPPNGQLMCDPVHGDPVKTGSMCNIRCNAGFRSDVGATSATCNDAVWEQTGNCVSDNRCSISTAQVLNGLATCNEDWVEMGGRCPVACDPGFVHRISTNDHVVCGGQNTWKTDYMGLSEMCAGVCRSEDVPSIENGNIRCSNNLFFLGGVCPVTCLPGYYYLDATVLIAKDDTAICELSGNGVGKVAWSTQARCVAVSRWDAQCFIDSAAPNRLLPAYEVKKATSMTREFCICECMSRGHRYAGVESMDWCYCGDFHPPTSALRTGECNLSCSGDSAQKCGGVWRMNFFDVYSRRDFCATQGGGK